MIYLSKIRVINWYGFSQITVPVGEFTLIAGKNGNGKSVLLDAIKYALYGDTVFNKSTENKGSRTLSSYTRGLLDATAGSYMRPADKAPNVYTHIVLEMFEKEMERFFILGTVLETNSGNGIVSQRYVIENKTLNEIEHTYQEGNLTFVYSASELQKKYGFKLMQVTEGIEKFMQRTGLRLKEQQLSTFRRKLRSIMSYDPNAKIDQFIREKVLEEKKVDFSKLVETKTKIDALTQTFERIDKEIHELEDIIKSFEELKKTRNILLGDDVKISYRQFNHFKEQLNEALRNIDMAERQIRQDEEKLEIIDEKEREVRKLYNSAKDNLSSMDCTKAIDDAKEELEKVKNHKSELENQKKNLLEFQNRISELMAWFVKENLSVPEQEVLSSLTLASYNKVEKENSVEKFLKRIETEKNRFFLMIEQLKNSIENNEKEQRRFQELIDDCDAQKANFTEIPEYVALKNEINREFEKRGIKSEARFACEYVIGLSDEDWRDTIEGYLGRRRYTILVEPEVYDIADDILNSSKYKYAHLFNTKLLMQKEVRLEDDSIVRFIDVKNSVARKYFEYQLGRFHATSMEQVKKYENAMSKEGRISVAMDSYFVRFDGIKFYCLGQETLELNKRKWTKKLEILKKEFYEFQEQKKVLQSKKSYLETEMELFGTYNYDAEKEYEAVALEYKQKEKQLKELLDAQKNNMEYMQLAQRVEELGSELEAVSGERKTVLENKSEQTTQLKLNYNQRDLAENSIEKYEKELQEYELQNVVVYKKAIEDYVRFKEGETAQGGILKDRQRAERAMEEAMKTLSGRQAAYNATRSEQERLPISESAFDVYQSRKSKIWVDDRQEIQESLKEQKRRYKDIFKNEFVLTVLKSCEAARSDLKLINSELAHLTFKETYEFEVKYVKDGSDYEKILEYARYLKEREEMGIKEGELTIDLVASYTNEEGEKLEHEIANILERLVDSNDKEKIERYGDYRNYMTYEILLTNDIYTKAKLSRQSGYNSGAEVQIPYMLILLSALLLVFNDKINSTRLVFIDEPFAKMDPINVKIMLGFMKEQNLQMIFCAPDKTELIGNECNVILPVLRSQPDLMEIGSIEIHKGVEN